MQKEESRWNSVGMILLAMAVVVIGIVMWPAPRQTRELQISLAEIRSSLGVQEAAELANISECTLHVLLSTPVQMWVGDREGIQLSITPDCPDGTVIPVQQPYLLRIEGLPEVTLPRGELVTQQTHTAWSVTSTQALKWKGSLWFYFQMKGSDILLAVIPLNIQFLSPFGMNKNIWIWMAGGLAMSGLLCLLFSHRKRRKG